MKNSKQTFTILQSASRGALKLIYIARCSKLD